MKKLLLPFLIKMASLVIFLLTSTLNVSYSQTKIDKIDKLVSAYSEYEQFNGSILVAEKGAVIYKKGFGSANMEWNIPNQPDTKHRLGSITKQFTAMAILQLVQQGKLKLDVPVSTYLPDYPKKNGEQITIHHLLTHTSGTPNLTAFPNFFKDISPNTYSPTELVKNFADSALQFKPGEKFAYSNSGYILLGAIIEKVTGKSYEQVVQENIFTPLKMNNTGYDHHGPLLKNRASGYEKNGRTYVNSNYIDMSVPYAAGSLYSTVEDLYLWDQALYTEKLLPKKYMDMLFAKHIQSSKGYYGYGWFMGEMLIGNTKEKVQTTGHGGGIDGFNTLITRIPSEQSLVVILNNTGGAPLHEMTIAINGILHDKPYEFPQRSLAHSLSDWIAKDGITTAILQYKKVKDSSAYYLDENEMNGAGYQFLQSGKVKEATEVFKLNTEAFPNAWNAFDSYGEALMALGEKKLAVESYRRSVELNPANPGGIKVLKEFGVYSDSLVKKVSIEYLKLLAGEYTATEQPEWKIIFEEVKGELFGNDRGYRYKLVPAGDEKFVNPDDGASLVFDTKDKSAITLVLFGKLKFKKVK